MHVAIHPEQQRCASEFRAYLARLMTPAVREATRDRESGPAYRELVRQMGRDGWLTPGWPQEYGGRGLDPLAQKIVLEELWLARGAVPVRDRQYHRSGAHPARHRGAEARTSCRASPAASSISPSATPRRRPAPTSRRSRPQAVREGDVFVINGQKIFTSGAEGADYIWLAARTDPPPPRIAASRSSWSTRGCPASPCHPIHTVGGVRTNVTYYEDVRVPAGMLVGELNGGWQLITEQLNHERVGLAALAYGAQGCFDDTLAWARARRPRAAAASSISRGCSSHSPSAMHCCRPTRYSATASPGKWRRARRAPQLASACKVFSTESYIRVLRLLLDVTGTAGLLQAGSPGAILQGRLESEYRRCQINTFGGGATEVLRDMVAQMGLGLPRAVACTISMREPCRAWLAQLRAQAARGGRACAAGARSRQSADDPPLVRGDGGAQPAVSR